MDPAPLAVGIGEILWDMLPGGRQLGGVLANFAWHAAALGARAAVISRVGDDALGREILGCLDALGLDRSGVSIDGEHSTGAVDVTLDAGGVPEYIIRHPAAWDFIQPAPALGQLAARADIVCFGTLAQRHSVSRRTIQSLMRSLPPRCLRIFDINLRQSYFDATLVEEMLGMSDVVKLNDAELPVVAALLKIPEQVDQFAAVMFDRFGLRALAITRGPRGSRIHGPDAMHDHPGIGVTVTDTVGAGDAFTAAVAMGLHAGKPLESISQAANELAAYVCTQSGATPTVPEKFRRWLEGLGSDK